MQNSIILNYFRRNSAFFLFVSLAFFSVAFFVQAESGSSSQNIFADADQDNLSNDEEKLYGTDPYKKDTDGDGYSDGVEIESGYNPLVPAPGDRIVPVTKAAFSGEGSVPGQSEDNLTAEASQQIVSLLQSSEATTEGVTLEQVNVVVEEILSKSAEEVVLPEVDMKTIKIKEAPSKKLKDKEREAEERQDVLEYLTSMSYIIANNSPSTFKDENDFSSLMGAVSNETIVALSSGNISYIEKLSERGQKILDESKEIEVPEAMLDVHVKALKMALYAVELKTEFKPNGEDPLGQIAVLSKLQGLLEVTSDFSQEVQGELEKYGITEIPLEI